MNAKTIGREYAVLLLLGLLGIPIGAAIGAVDVLFGRVLLAVSAVRTAHVTQLVPFLAPIGVLIVWAYAKYGGVSSKGMSLVFDVGHGKESNIPLRLVPFVMVSTWLTHLFGGSAGREGVAVQLGAAISHGFGKRLENHIPDAPRIFLITGMAAGFSGLFQTPIAATLFAIEVLSAGSLALSALVPAVTASFTACWVSSALGLEKFSVAISADISLNLPVLGKLAVLGVLFGLTGGIFAWGLRRAKALAAQKLQHPLVRSAVMGACLSALLLLHTGRYCGLGTNLISACFSGGTVYSYDWLLKLVLTIGTLAAGYQGGEVTPLFSIGATLGVLLSGIVGLPVGLTAALGYAAVFGSATNTVLAPVLIGAEVFGMSNLPYFFIVCAVAFACNRNASIYTKQHVTQF